MPQPTHTNQPALIPNSSDSPPTHSPKQGY